MSKWVRIGALVTLVVAVIATFALFGHHSRSGAALQRYKAELRAKGEKLTFTELNADHVQEPDLATIAFTNAVNKLASERLSPGYLAYLQFTAPGQAQAAVQLSNPPFASQTPLKHLLSWPESSGPLRTLEDYVFLPVYKTSSINEDELFYLQTIQGALDAVRILDQGRSWPEVKKLLAANFARMGNISSPVQRYRFLFSNLSIPNFQRAFEIAIRNETHRQLTITMLALKRYQLEHATSPDSLNALVPQYLSALPRDHMSGQTLRHRMKPDGTALLYSVGDDGQDDGGDAGSTNAVSPLSLWSGQDAVWPEPRPAP